MRPISSTDSHPDENMFGLYIKLNIQEGKTMNAKLSVEIISDYCGIITVATVLMGKLISAVVGAVDDVFMGLTRLFEGVKVLSEK